jgi:16S rRNA (cytosine1402-N4)-methyltransferase
LPETHVRLPSFTAAVKGAVGPSVEEEERNPRARSAKLRAGLRTENPPLEDDLSLFGLPKLPETYELARS